MIPFPVHSHPRSALRLMVKSIVIAPAQTGKVKAKLTKARLATPGTRPASTVKQKKLSAFSKLVMAML